MAAHPCLLWIGRWVRPSWRLLLPHGSTHLHAHPALYVSTLRSPRGMGTRTSSPPAPARTWCTCTKTWRAPKASTAPTARSHAFLVLRAPLVRWGVLETRVVATAAACVRQACTALELPASVCSAPLAGTVTAVARHLPTVLGHVWQVEAGCVAPEPHPPQQPSCVHLVGMLMPLVTRATPAQLVSMVARPV
jgi:hypothetical protein